MASWAQSSQRTTWPPRAAVRQFSIADIAFNWPRLTWPALASRQAWPWPRKISATSRARRATRSGRQAGASGSAGLPAGILARFRVKGFGRRPLARGGARHGEAGVRKPPKEETAFRKGRWRRSCDLWGFEVSQSVGGEVLKRRLIELVPDSGIEWPAYGRCRNPFWRVVGADLGIA